MGRCVLAGMQASAAVVTEVRQKVNIGLAKLQSARHGQESAAKAFAITASVADLHLAGHLAFGGAELAPGQGPGFLGQSFKRLHG